MNKNTLTIGSIESLVLAVVLIWLGSIVGVSFIAAPAKFMVAELDLVTAIKIGRSTFMVFHYFEYVLLASLMILIGFFKVSNIARGLVLILLALTLIQNLIIYPALGGQSNLMFNGEVGNSKVPHLIYVGMEVVKSIILLLYFPLLVLVAGDED